MRGVHGCELPHAHRALRPPACSCSSPLHSGPRSLQTEALAWSNTFQWTAGLPPGAWFNGLRDTSLPPRPGSQKPSPSTHFCHVPGAALRYLHVADTLVGAWPPVGHCVDHIGGRALLIGCCRLHHCVYLDIAEQPELETSVSIGLIKFCCLQLSTQRPSPVKRQARLLPAAACSLPHSSNLQMEKMQA